MISFLVWGEAGQGGDNFALSAFRPSLGRQENIFGRENRCLSAGWLTSVGRVPGNVHLVVYDNRFSLFFIQ